MSSTFWKALFPPRQSSLTSSNTPAMPPKPTWDLINGVLVASLSHLQTSADWTADNASDDEKIRFLFPPPTPAIHVHASRLRWAGGPLAALLEHDFKERSQSAVDLCEEDDYDTFAVIRDFVYCKKITLKGRTLRALFRVVRSAHRWELADLVELFCAFVVDEDALENGMDVMEAVECVTLLDLPDKFLNYFWSRVGRYFDQLGSGQQDVMDGDHEEDSSVQGGVEVEAGMRWAQNHVARITNRLCPMFPGIWEVAMRQEVLFNLFNDIFTHSQQTLTMDLLDVVMLYAEPLVDDTDPILDAISLLVRKCKTYAELLGHASIRRASPRGISLFALALEKKNQSTNVGVRVTWTFSMWDKTFPPRSNIFEHPVDRHRCDEGCRRDPRCPVAAFGLDPDFPIEQLSRSQLRALMDSSEDHGPFMPYAMSSNGRAARLYRMKEKEFMRPGPAKLEIRCFAHWHKDTGGVNHLKCKFELSFGQDMPFRGEKMIFRATYIEDDCICKASGKRRVLVRHEQEVTSQGKGSQTIQVEIPPSEIPAYFERHDKGNECKLKMCLELDFMP